MNLRAVGHACLSSTLATVFLTTSSFFAPGGPSAKKIPVRILRTSMQASGNLRSKNLKRTRLAEGEYVVVARSGGGGVGPFVPAVYDFHESWTLWLAGDGGYEVEGEREYKSPKDEFHRNRFWVRLARNWRLETIKEFARLRWRPDSGPLVCDFEIAALHCTSNAKEPSQLVKLDLKFDQPFGFLWPISAFSLASIARAADRRPHEIMPVQVITVEELSPAEPIFPLVLGGRLRYLGNVEVTLAGRKWKANQFELEVPLQPKFRILTAPEGFLLDLIVVDPAAESPRSEMKLVRYRRWADLPSHPER